jgi:multiple antibiotic resistance protein
MWFGHQLLGALNISAADFKIAGGLVLLIFAINGILHDAPRHSGIVKEHVGVVPIGVPMMVGPATLVTLLLLADLYPAWAVSSGLVVNILLSLVIFRTHRLWERIFHANGIRAISKIVHFFLAAIAVMMIRVGIMEVLG